MKTNLLSRTLAVLALVTSSLVCAQNAGPAGRAAALAEARAGNWGRAEPVLADLAAAEPTDPEVCAVMVGRRLEERRHKEAVQLAERAVQAAPDEAGLQSLLGRALAARIGEVAFIQQGEIAMRMLSAFQRAESLDPRHVPALAGLASYYLTAPEVAGGSLDRAETYARKVAELAPCDGALLLARVAERRADWAAAARHYCAAAALQPRNAWLQSELGRVLAAAGDVAAARRAYETALAIDGNCESARTRLKELAALGF